MLETFHEHLGRREAAVKVNSYKIEPRVDLKGTERSFLFVVVVRADHPG